MDPFAWLADEAEDLDGPVTGRELRVTLYSTKWVEVKANGQDAQRKGDCTLYVTKRQRISLDGRVASDFTKVQYRSGEGQLCG